MTPTLSDLIWFPTLLYKEKALLTGLVSQLLPEV